MRQFSLLILQVTFVQMWWIFPPGGKIWFDLHRVSPGNVFDKNLNKALFKISHQKIFKQQLVHKIVLWLYKNSNSRHFRQNELFFISVQVWKKKTTIFLHEVP